MTRLSFDVLQEPWIPVVRLDGSTEELGILPCLTRAHEFREIRDPSPIVEFGLNRLLVAFLLDELISEDERPANSIDLKRLLVTGRFDQARLIRYAAHCGRVFDLFDEGKPFLQCLLPGGSAKPLAAMYPGVPSGTNVGLWHHVHEDDTSVSPAAAARMLTAIAPFMTEGGRGLSPSINGAPPIYCLPLGVSLFETLVINLPTGVAEADAGKVAWRELREPGSERTGATTVEALTWRPRAVQLIPGVQDGARVETRSIKFERGDSTRFEGWRDPNLAYRFDKDKVTPIRMREGKPIWRDAGPLVLPRSGEHGTGDSKAAFTCPAAVETAFGVLDGAQDIQIKVYGIRTDKMKVFEWAASYLSVPANLGRSTSLGRIVYGELDRAERAAFQLRVAIRGLYPREGAGNKSAMATSSNRAERAYWLGLEAQFHPLMERFAALPEEAAEELQTILSSAEPWRDAIKGIGEQQFELVARDMDADGDAIERSVRARGRFRSSLRKILE